MMDTYDFEKLQAALELMNEIAKGQRSGEEKGWIDLAEVEAQPGVSQE